MHGIVCNMRKKSIGRAKPPAEGDIIQLTTTFADGSKPIATIQVTNYPGSVPKYSSAGVAIGSALVPRFSYSIKNILGKGIGGASVRERVNLPVTSRNCQNMMQDVFTTVPDKVKKWIQDGGRLANADYHDCIGIFESMVKNDKLRMMFSVAITETGDLRSFGRIRENSNSG